MNRTLEGLGKEEDGVTEGGDEEEGGEKGYHAGRRIGVATRLHGIGSSVGGLLVVLRGLGRESLRGRGLVGLLLLDRQAGEAGGELLLDGSRGEGGMGGLALGGISAADALEEDLDLRGREGAEGEGERRSGKREEERMVRMDGEGGGEEGDGRGA